MIEKRKGGIINVASVAGFMPMPFWTNYSASKSYLLHLSEGLWFEFRKNKVDVLALCPGGTRTEFAEVAGTKSSGMKASEVVRIALKNTGKKPTVVAGVSNRIIALILRLLPRKTIIKIGAKVVTNMAGKNL